MTYFLDFDRTLFDTDAYNSYLLTLPACAAFRDELQDVLSEGRDETLLPTSTRTAVWDKLTDLVKSGELSFAPGELSQFVYHDVQEFLRMMGNEAIIITYGEKIRQKVKLESALAGIVRLTVLYTEELLKAEYLEKYPHLVPAQALFVDDVAEHLAGIEASFPHVQLFEMRRDGKEGTGRWKTVHSLTELP
jgi:hypothetical protein